MVEFDNMGGGRRSWILVKPFTTRFMSMSGLGNILRKFLKLILRHSKLTLCKAHQAAAKFTLVRHLQVERVYITYEPYEARQKLLHEVFKECNASQQLIERWLKIDDAFLGRIV